MKIRTKKFFRKKRPMIQINVVPYIDVMLVLLVIFMITAPILTRVVKVDLPKVKSSTNSKKFANSKPIIITVDKQGEYFINQGTNNSKTVLDSVALANAVTSLSDQDRNRSIYVRGDSSATYGQVIQAMAIIQKAGIDKVSLVIEDD